LNLTIESHVFMVLILFVIAPDLPRQALQIRYDESSAGDQNSMLLFEIVRTSQQVGQTSGRLDKLVHLGACLRHLAPEEIEIGVNFLAGRLRQGTIGIGAATLRSVAAVAATKEPVLTLAQVDAACETISRTTGAGSTAERRRILDTLFSHATTDEQHFLLRLFVGELRQGALEGIMAEAIARAANVPAASVRRAQNDRLDLDTTIVTGNRELPKVLYIVPWKKADLGDLPAQPFNTLLDEVLTPVDRDVFRREVTYYGVVSSGGKTTPAAPAGGDEK